MAKNFATIYDNTGDSIALEQKFFAKEETTKGTLIGPVDGDFFFTQAGGSITHTQPKQSSPHRSGRHNTDTFAEKKVTEWSIPTFVNIDTGAAAGDAEVEDGIQVLWKSMLGKETVSGSVVFDPSDTPDITFSLFENGDKWAQQVPGCAVESVTINLPGDGQAGYEWSGRGADRFRVGIAKSVVDNNTGNTITLDTTSHSKRFPVGALVMIVESDGTTRSADTPNGSYRKVTASASGVVTVDGAVLADADGSTNEVYLCYAEPESPTGISEIQTGLVGGMTLGTLPSTTCIRSATITLTNNHEYVDYCYGTDGLASPYFVAGGRLDVECEFELNLNDTLIEFLYDLDSFTSQNIDIDLGDTSTRHLHIDLPKVVFDVASTTVPEEGSIPVTLTGMGLQTTSTAADEVKISYL